MKKLKTGGRQKGTPNKLTQELRGSISELLQSEMESLPSLLKELSPHQRIDAYCKLAKFVLPTLKHSEIEAEVTDLKPMSLEEFYLK